MDINDICELFYYNDEDFDVAIIKSRENNKVVFYGFNMFGEYNGLILQENRAIESICFSDRYIDFYKKIINIDTIPNLTLNSKLDFINYSMENNRILAIVTKKQEFEDFNDIKVLECDGITIKYQIYARWGELFKRVHKVKISDIVMMQIDSKYTRLLESVREE